MTTREGYPISNGRILAEAGTDSSCWTRNGGHVHGAQFGHDEDLSHRPRPDKEITIYQAWRTAIAQARSKRTGTPVSRRMEGLVRIKKAERTTDINIPSQVTIKVQVRPVMETRPKVLWRKKNRLAKDVVEEGDGSSVEYTDLELLTLAKMGQLHFVSIRLGVMLIIGLIVATFDYHHGG